MSTSYLLILSPNLLRSKIPCVTNFAENVPSFLTKSYVIVMGQIQMVPCTVCKAVKVSPGGSLGAKSRCEGLCRAQKEHRV